MERFDIFISYRRNGGEDLAQLLYFHLTNKGYRVFLDIESLRAGKFNEALYAKIEECTDFLLILPPKALDRCVNEGDWVRLEIAHAIKHNKNIIPVIMPDFEIPKKETLPEDIRDVIDYHGVETHRRYYLDMIRELEVKFLRSQKQTDGAAPKNEDTQCLTAEPAESLIIPRNWFRCPKCGARKIQRTDRLDRALLIIDSIIQILRKLIMVFLGALVVFVTAYFCIEPAARDSYETLLSQWQLFDLLFIDNASQLVRWMFVFVAMTLPPALLFYGIQSIFGSLYVKLYTNELVNGSHTVRCNCKNCATAFLAVSLDKTAEDWKPPEEVDL